MIDILITKRIECISVKKNWPTLSDWEFLFNIAAKSFRNFSCVLDLFVSSVGLELEGVESVADSSTAVVLFDWVGAAATFIASCDFGSTIANGFLWRFSK